MKTTWTKKGHKAIQRRELDDYLMSIGLLSKKEKRKLREWVAAGNSVQENPYTLYDDSGWPMDFINGLRIGNEMRDFPSHFTWDDTVGYAGNADTDGDIPY